MKAPNANVSASMENDMKRRTRGAQIVINQPMARYTEISTVAPGAAARATRLFSASVFTGANP